MKDTLLGIIADICEEGSVRDNLDMELVESGLLDSLGFVELLVEIENELGVVISPSEVSRADMNTPGKIISQVEKWLSHE